MKRAMIWLVLPLFLGLAACLQMDDLAFPRDNSITEYLFDNYTGDSELQLPASYDFPASIIHLFTLNSQGPDEISPTTIYAVYIGDLNTLATDTVIVYCHGQSKHMDYYWTRAKLLANTHGKNHYGVLMMDYRGYGLSEGTPTEAGLSYDVQACLQWLKAQGAAPENVMIYGFSLGCIPAIDIAAYYDSFKPAKLIIESPLASVDNLTEESTILNVSASFIVSLKFNNAEKIKDVNIPLCWFHGEEDDYVQISNGEIIYQNYQGPYKEAHRIPGAKHGHNGIPETMGLDNYLQVVDAFIRR